jgi:hypothetical protein
MHSALGGGAASSPHGFPRGLAELHSHNLMGSHLAGQHHLNHPAGIKDGDYWDLVMIKKAIQIMIALLLK